MIVGVGGLPELLRLIWSGATHFVKVRLATVLSLVIVASILTARTHRTKVRCRWVHRSDERNAPFVASPDRALRAEPMVCSAGKCMAVSRRRQYFGDMRRRQIRPAVL